MEACAAAMEAIVARIQGVLDLDQAPELRAHLASCPRCREAHADAMACAPGLRAAGPGAGPADPPAWERRLFLRLLADQVDGAGPRRPARWGRMALQLGREAAREVGATWQRWQRAAEGGASR